MSLNSLLNRDKTNRFAFKHSQFYPEKTKEKWRKTPNDWLNYWNLTEIVHTYLHRRRRNCFEPKEIGSVTHQYGVARCPIRCQPSGSPFEGYEAGSILSFLWLAFREGHLLSRPFVSSLIYVPRSLSYCPSVPSSLSSLRFYPALLSFSFPFFSFNLPTLSARQGTVPFCSWSPRASSFAESFTVIPTDRIDNDTIINANDL